MLSNGVVKEILAFGLAVTSETFINREATETKDKKLSSLAKVMLDELYKASSVSSEVRGGVSDVYEGKFEEEMSTLANFLAQSALNSIVLSKDVVPPSYHEFYTKVEPMVDNLSFKIINEVSIFVRCYLQIFVRNKSFC